MQTIVSGRELVEVKNSEPDKVSKEIVRSSKDLMIVEDDEVYSKMSRNTRNPLSPSKRKTQNLPNVNRSTSRALVPVKSKSKVRQLAITDGSKFPSKNSQKKFMNVKPFGNKTWTK